MTPDTAHTLGRFGRWLALLGVIGLLVAFVMGFVMASWNSTYYSAAPDVRLTAGPGSDVGNAFKNIQVYNAWIGPTQFLSIGLILTGIGLQFAPIVSMLALHGSGIRDSITQVGSTMAPMEKKEKRAA